jgi:hypothetical protein
MLWVEKGVSCLYCINQQILSTLMGYHLTKQTNNQCNKKRVNYTTIKYLMDKVFFHTYQGLSLMY